MTIEETLQIALDAHEGQKDLDGKPAILHPVAVGIMGSNDAEIKAGFLHDMICGIKVWMKKCLKHWNC